MTTKIQEAMKYLNSFIKNYTILMELKTISSTVVFKFIP